MSTSRKAGRCIHIKKRWIETRAGREAIALYRFILPWVIGFVVLTVVIMLAGLMVTFTIRI